jgi:hypothetical protein
METAPTAGTTQPEEKYRSNGAGTRRKTILSHQSRRGEKSIEATEDDTLLFLALSSVIVS